jgi:hypothetical protein
MRLSLLLSFPVFFLILGSHGTAAFIITIGTIEFSAYLLYLKGAHFSAEMKTRAFH